MDEKNYAQTATAGIAGCDQATTASRDEGPRPAPRRAMLEIKEVNFALIAAYARRDEVARRHAEYTDMLQSAARNIGVWQIEADKLKATHEELNAHVHALNSAAIRAHTN